jgi:hypothetical protein
MAEIVKAKRAATAKRIPSDLLVVLRPNVLGVNMLRLNMDQLNSLELALSGSGNELRMSLSDSLLQLTPGRAE